MCSSGVWPTGVQLRCVARAAQVCEVCNSGVRLKCAACAVQVYN